MSLTPKRESFAQAVASGMSQADAYRAAFDASRMKPETIQSAASRLMADSKVSARVEEIRAPIVQKAQITLESHLERLKQLSEKAEQEGQFSAAISAEVSRGKASGLYTEKIDHSSSDGSMTPAGLGHFYGSSTESGGDA
ncbi:phage small subunit terminase [Stutzerimonas stutzeri B1SMN1]|jgi:DNA-binding transcriptional LysR family regulator|nr:phage small subunit terminase [Stutzerimonas stutzeri B1SMN1]